MPPVTEVVSGGSPNRVAELANQARHAVAWRTDRLFVGLLVFEWVFAVGLAVWVSPFTWAGASYHTHPHIWAAVLLGLTVISLPVALGLFRPGQTLTRHVIAIGQLLTTALLIHLTGGRIETHFHVFGSLAFLAFYRDWRVLVTATVVTAADHIIRGYLWPESTYGTTVGVEWRWVEHAAWVVFIDLFLVYSCIRGDREIQVTAERETELETARAGVEEQVRVRTAELQESEERFRGALEHAAIGMALVAPDGRWLRVNPALCDIVGYTEPELLSRTFQDITHPDDLSADLEQFDRLISKEIEAYHLEKRYIHKAGHAMRILLSVSAVRDVAGVPLYFVAQVQDITERKRAEDELRRTRGQLDDAIESLNAGFVMYDENERLLVCNTRFKELYPLCWATIRNAISDN